MADAAPARRPEGHPMLYELIKAHAPAEAAAADWNGVVAKLTAANIEKTYPQPLTYARIRELFGEPARQLVALTIRTRRDTFIDGNPIVQAATRGEMADAHNVMLNELAGLRIDLADRQDQIDDLAAAGGWSDELRDGIKALGKQMLAPWQDAGLETAPTVTLVQAAWDAQMDQDERDRLIAAINEGQAAAAVFVLDAPTPPDDADVVEAFTTTFNATRAAQGA